MIEKNLTEIRKEKKLTQKQLAEKLQIKPNTLCQYEKGQRDIPTKTIYQLCKIIEVTPNEMFGIYEWQFEEKKDKVKRQ